MDVSGDVAVPHLLCPLADAVNRSFFDVLALTLKQMQMLAVTPLTTLFMGIISAAEATQSDKGTPSLMPSFEFYAVSRMHWNLNTSRPPPPTHTHTHTLTVRHCDSRPLGIVP